MLFKGLDDGFRYVDESIGCLGKGFVSIFRGCIQVYRFRCVDNVFVYGIEIYRCVDGGFRCMDKVFRYMDNGFRCIDLGIQVMDLDILIMDLGVQVMDVDVQLIID